MLRINFLSALLIAVFSFSNLQAQEIAGVVEVVDTVKDVVESAALDSLAEAEKSVTSVSLDKEGNLLGKTFIAGEKTPLEAKVTIANSEGVVVDTVVAQEDGSFAFTSVAPGTYNMYGSAAALSQGSGTTVSGFAPSSSSSSSFVGAQTFDVVPFSGGSGCSSCDLGLSTCLLYTSPSPRDATLSRMPSSA